MTTDPKMLRRWIFSLISLKCHLLKTYWSLSYDRTHHLAPHTRTLDSGESCWLSKQRTVNCYLNLVNFSHMRTSQLALAGRFYARPLIGESALARLVLGLAECVRRRYHRGYSLHDAFTCALLVLDHVTTQYVWVDGFTVRAQRSVHEASGQWITKESLQEGSYFTVGITYSNYNKNACPVESRYKNAGTMGYIGICNLLFHYLCTSPYAEHRLFVATFKLAKSVPAFKNLKHNAQHKMFSQ